MSKIRNRLIVWGLSALLTTTSLFASDYDHHWAKDAIDKWSANGMVKGYEDNTFRPNQMVTRAEFAAILSRVFELKKIEGAPSYVDILSNSDKWYVESVQKVTALGIMHVEGTQFNPDQKMTREEAAYAIAKAYEISNDQEAPIAFKDEMLMADWSKEAIQSLASKKYIAGNPDGSFNPTGTLTRAELVSMLDKVTKHLLVKPGVYQESLIGNVIVNTKGIILKDMTIEGNLYLTQGIEKNEMILDNVTVKGNVYVNGGQITMSGQYDNVFLATGLPLHVTKGKVNNLVVNKADSILKLEKEATIEAIVQNQLLVIEGNGSAQGKPIGGAPLPNGVEQSQEIKIDSAGVYINNAYVELPVNGNHIILDVPTLSHQFNREDVLSGLVIKTNLDSAIISSQWGTMQSNSFYTFIQAEEALGMIREIAIEAGVSPTLVINYVFGSGQLTIGGLLDDYETAQKTAAALGIHLKNQYVLTRTLSQGENAKGSFAIELCLR